MKERRKDKEKTRPQKPEREGLFDHYDVPLPKSRRPPLVPAYPLAGPIRWT